MQRVVREATARSVLVLVVALASISAVLAAQKASTNQPKAHDEIGGTLPDGTIYLIRVPKNWNGTVINDLDYAANPDAEFRQYWLGRGYATSGTQRHELRQYLYDPAQEAYNQLRVLDLLEAKFGKAKRVIQYGQSGGGLIAAAMAELYPDRVDGSVSGCFQMPIPLHSMRLDMFFALKALLAPDRADLPVVNIPEDIEPVMAAWRDVVSAAQKTPEGRARIALAMTLAQHPSWTDSKTPEPNPKDPAAVQASMFHSIVEQVIPQTFRTRQRNENSGGGVFVSNIGVDYETFFANGYEPHKWVVWQLYRDAGLDVAADLTSINRAPRIAADPRVLQDFWLVPPRTLSGDPKVPILQIGTLGDEAAPQEQMQAYASRVRSLGKGRLYRQAVVHGAGHCRFTTSERATAIEIMMRRLDTGQWPSTSPKTLNALGRSLKLDTPRFMSHEWPVFNRAIFLESEPAGEPRRPGTDE